MGARSGLVAGVRALREMTLLFRDAQEVIPLKLFEDRTEKPFDLRKLLLVGLAVFFSGVLRMHLHLQDFADADVSSVLLLLDLV